MSDIFNEYAKIAINQNLIKEAEPTKEHNPRYDSLDLEAIQMLYGVKPNGDEKHIVEQAHPQPALVAPAYDKVNGLVENQLEQQNLMHQIVTKPNHGKHVQERYVKAHQELINEVVKIGFMLDHKNEEQLMRFADTCAEALVNKPLLKKADTFTDILGQVSSILGPAAAGIITGVAFSSGPIGIAVGAGLLGAVAAVNHFGYVDKGALGNAQTAAEELKDIIKDKDEGVGLESKIQEMITLVNDFISKNQAASQMIVEDEEDIKNAEKVIEEYSDVGKKLLSNIPSWINLLEAAREKDKENYHSSFLGPLTFLRDMAEFVWTPDTTDAIKALETLQESIQESVNAIKRLNKTVKDQLEKAKKAKEDSKETGKEEGKEDSKETDKEEGKEMSLEELLNS